VAYKYVALAKL